MAKKKKQRPQNVDSSHQVGYVAMRGMTSSEIVCKLRTPEKILGSEVVADGINEQEFSGLIELAKLICHCLNAGISEDKLVGLVARVVKFSAENGNVTAPGYKSLGLEVVQPLLVSYLFQEEASGSKFEIQPQHRTLRLEDKNEPDKNCKASKKTVRPPERPGGSKGATDR